MKSIKKPKLDVNNLEHIRLNIHIPLHIEVMRVIITSAEGQKTFRSNKGIDNYTKKILHDALGGEIKLSLDFNKKPPRINETVSNKKLN